MSEFSYEPPSVDRGTLITEVVADNAGQTSLVTGATHSDSSHRRENTLEEGRSETRMSKEQSIRVVAFSGKQDGWCEWELKFVAKALANGYYSILDGTTSVPAASVVLDATKDADKKPRIEARKKNREAWIHQMYSALALSFSRAALGRIAAARTTDLPDGDAMLAWKNLKCKYEPLTKLSPVSLQKQFAAQNKP